MFTLEALLHENSPAHGGCEFARFFHSTPDDLIDSGLFNDIAVALYTSEEELAVSRAFVRMALRGKGDDPFDVKQTTSALMRRGLRKLCYSWSNGSTRHPGVMTRLRANPANKNTLERPRGGNLGRPRVRFGDRLRTVRALGSGER